MVFQKGKLQYFLLFFDRGACCRWGAFFGDADEKERRCSNPDPETTAGKKSRKDVKNVPAPRWCMAANKGESMTMNRPLRLSAIIAMVCCAACFSQTDSLMKPDTLPKKVLIAMGKSYMEKAVSAIVKDSLSARGYAVTIVSMKALNDQDRREYRAIILFSAVRAVELTEAAKKFIRSQEGIGEQSNMLICDVYGEQWNPRKEDFSAIASATKNVRPEITAAKIISNFNAIVNK
jgi:hypothetical protein